MSEDFRCVVRELRKNQTNSEKIFWNAVRNRKVCGKRIIRQFPITYNEDGISGFFVADFYCSEKKLVIEIDGESHRDKKEYDEYRTEVINDLGMTVVRFKSREVENNLDSVIKRLRKYLR